MRNRNSGHYAERIPHNTLLGRYGMANDAGKEHSSKQVMRFDEVVNEIESFWGDEPLRFQGGGVAAVNRLQGQFTNPFPDELKAYVGTVLPPRSFSLQNFGRTLTLYGYEELSSRSDGYNWNPKEQIPLDGWNQEWVLIGDEDADPVIVDLSKAGQHCPVFEAMHGAGEWKFWQVASSLPQFLLCAAYMHHALIHLDKEPIVEKRRFPLPSQMILANKVADWLLPRLKQCDEEFWGYWVGHFANARE